MTTQTLRQLRMSAGVTQEEAGKVLGITKQAYGRKENGFREVTLTEAAKLAELFGVNDSTILRARRVPESVTEEAPGERATGDPAGGEGGAETE